MANSYMITNRNQPAATSFWKIVPLSGNQVASLWWYMANGAYNQTPADYIQQASNPSQTPPSNFQNAIVAQLKAQTTPRLVAYIHGLGDLWNNAIISSALFASNLATLPTFGGGYTGLLVGFSWPSYNEIESDAAYGTSWPSEKTSGSIRDNINGSVQSFGSLISWLQNMRIAVPGLTVSIMCHSEGNYMAMLGMAALSSVSIDQVILLAADINNAALQLPDGGYAGNGAKIATLSKRVTVYHSASDNAVAASEGAYGGLAPLGKDLHNPRYNGRLGLSGPSFNDGAQQPKMVGLDCSAVAQYTNPNLPNGIIVHSSYRYIPQILADITQTLQNASAGSVTNRTPTKNPNSYYMNYVS